MFTLKLGRKYRIINIPHRINCMHITNQGESGKKCYRKNFLKNIFIHWNFQIVENPKVILENIRLRSQDLLLQYY